MSVTCPSLAHANRCLAAARACGEPSPLSPRITVVTALSAIPSRHAQLNLLRCGAPSHSPSWRWCRRAGRPGCDGLAGSRLGVVDGLADAQVDAWYGTLGHSSQ
eukprot:4785296-Prymnesium_polylepis.1